MSPARRSRREAAAGDGPTLGEKTAEVVFAMADRGAEHLRCLPYRLHWFLPGEGCRGRREEAASLTPREMLLM